MVPLAESDFMPSVVGEELGVTGLVAVIILYAILVERCLRTSVICADPFGKLLAVGFGSVLAFQVFVVVGGATKLIPETGLTTPFMSYGGSSLIANWALIALLLRLSDQARRPAPVPLDLPPGTAEDESDPALRLPREYASRGFATDDQPGVGT
jgi:cell division protein FtsW (lipid II flippase)